MKTLEEIKKDLQKLRDKLSEVDTGDGFGRATSEEIDYIAEYIESTISQTKQELIEEIKEKIKGYYVDRNSNGWNEGLDIILEDLEKLSNK